MRFRNSWRIPFQLHSNATGGHFTDATEKLGVHFRQQAAPTSKKYLLETMSSGVAVFDYDNDGRLDTSNDGPAWVLLNQTETANHWITLNLVGTKSNRDGIGAQVKISTANGDQFGTVTTTSSYQSSSDKRVHFGLGTADSIRQIEIRWPSGIRQIIKDANADQVVKITEPAK
jgi:hypothetical protein